MFPKPIRDICTFANKSHREIKANYELFLQKHTHNPRSRFHRCFPSKNRLELFKL